jgi:D-3-phosphoglycerate dehydrogenase
MGQLLRLKENATAPHQRIRRVLVTDPIAAGGVARLEESLDVEVADGWSETELLDRIRYFDALIVRSATRVSAELIDRAEELRVIVRAGVGVDNVDVEAATRRGILVANAPESTVVSAAELTIALLLALARNIPQADRALHEGEWDRSRFAGIELEGKVVAVLGFGRIGRLVAAKARALGMIVIAFDPYVAAERFTEAGAIRCEDLDVLLAQADFLTIHLPRTPKTEGLIDDAALEKLKPGARIVNCARGGIVVESALLGALDSGRVAGAALDVFEQEPLGDHPLLERDGVIVTPHLGASTREAQDAAGLQAAEQVIAALADEIPVNAVNLPVAPLPALGPWTDAAMTLAERLGALAAALIGERDSLSGIEVAARGDLTDLGLPLLGAAALAGVLGESADSALNYLNAPLLARERGISLVELREPDAEESPRSLRVTAVTSSGGRMDAVGALGAVGLPPRLLRLWGQHFDVELAEHLTVLRYRDQPGMLGYVGTLFGERGLNIAAAAVGRHPFGPSHESEQAAMVITTPQALPREWLEEILDHPGFHTGRTVGLQGLDGSLR